jgi:curli biogenesis system outer membrane secretion channel CsgG
MFTDPWRTFKYQKSLWLSACLAISIFSGCAAKAITRTSIDQLLLKQENIRRVAVLSFESSLDDPQAGSHISKLFETNLLQTGFYQIAERGEIEKVLKERGLGAVPGANQATLRQLGELLQVDGIVFGFVSQYNRFNLGFTARLVSVKSGLILWSVSQTGGRLFRPLSQVADETVQAAVQELKAKIR